MKIALVHDYLREFGGAERVVVALHELFPEAPLYTAYYNRQKLGKFAEKFTGWDIQTSWLQKWPMANTLVSPFRLFAPLMFESFDLSKFDVVISSCNIYYSKAVITKPETLHISYIHSPPRYLYGYTTSFNYKKHWWTRLGAAVANHLLRVYDFETSQRPDILIANSKNVQERIKKFYRRDSVVIYPPVDVKTFGHQPLTLKSEDKKYFLSLSRLWKGKGVDIIVQACTKLDLPLKVVGDGPELESLKKIAGRSVEFLGAVSDRERTGLYQQAQALIVASEDEDFGITSVEAQAAGIPVIAIRCGGYLESVIENKTGLFFDKSTADFLAQALVRFDPDKFKAEDCVKNAEKFSKERFKKEILALINKNHKRS